MGAIRVKWGNPIPNGTYKADRKLIAIEDPRQAKYDEENLMKGTEWATKTIMKNQPFTIQGNFQLRNKTWYELKSKSEKPMVINHIVMINALLKPNT